MSDDLQKMEEALAALSGTFKVDVATESSPEDRKERIDRITQDFVMAMTAELRGRMVDMQSEFNTIVGDSEGIKRMYTRIGLNDALCLALKVQDREAALEIINHPAFQLDRYRVIKDRNILDYAMRHDEEVFFRLLGQPYNDVSLLLMMTPIIKYCVEKDKASWVEPLLCLSKEKRDTLLGNIVIYSEHVNLSQAPYNKFISTILMDNIHVVVSYQCIADLIKNSSTAIDALTSYAISQLPDISAPMGVDFAGASVRIELQKINYRDSQTKEFTPLMAAILYKRWNLASLLLENDNLDFIRCTSRPENSKDDLTLIETLQQIAHKNTLSPDAHAFIDKLEEKMGCPGSILSKRRSNPTRGWLRTRRP